MDPLHGRDHLSEDNILSSRSLRGKAIPHQPPTGLAAREIVVSQEDTYIFLGTDQLYLFPDMTS